MVALKIKTPHSSKLISTGHNTTAFKHYVTKHDILQNVTPYQKSKLQYLKKKKMLQNYTTYSFSKITSQCTAAFCNNAPTLDNSGQQNVPSFEILDNFPQTTATFHISR